MHKIRDKLIRCDLFVSVGTSGVVYPAAGFIAEVQEIGQAHSMEINIEPSAVHTSFVECRQGKAGDMVPVLVEELLGTARR